MQKYLTTSDVAEMLQVTPETVWNWIRAGKLRAIKIGRGWRITEEDLKAFLACL